MDRLVKVEAAEVELNFRPSERCSAVIKVTSLIHTMPVTVKLTTTRPAAYSVSPNSVALLQPLSFAFFTLVLLPTAVPPLFSPPDSVLVVTALAPSLRRANSATLHRFFSHPAISLFRDATLPIHLLGPHVLRLLLVPSSLQQDLLLPRIIRSCSPMELSAALPLADGRAVPALLNAGADPNTRNVDGKPIISLAVTAGCAEAVEALLEAGATDRPFHEAAAANRTDLIALLLARSGSVAWPNWADAEGRTPVHWAAARGCLDALSFCLSAGGDPNRTDDSGWTPLHHAAAGGYIDAVELLITFSDFDLRHALTRREEGKRRTPFDLAAEKGYDHLYGLLRPGGAVIQAARCGACGDVVAAMKAGGEASERDKNGWTALHVAALKGRVEAVRELAERGAELEAVNDAGYTPLMCAVEARRTEVALFLVSCGARAGLKGLVQSKRDDVGGAPAATDGNAGVMPVSVSCAAAVYSTIKNNNNRSLKSKGFEAFGVAAAVADR